MVFIVKADDEKLGVKWAGGGGRDEGDEDEQ